MKKIMSLFSSFVFLVSCCSSQVNVAPPTSTSSVLSSKKDKSSQHVETVRRIKYLTVKLNNLDPGSLDVLCSAVWIKQGVLLTANHCIRGSTMLSYSTLDDADELIRLAVPYAQDIKNDLAILYVDPATEPPHDIAKLSDDVIESGEDVDIIGHTMGFEWTYSKGYIAAVRNNMSGPGLTETQKVIQISSPAWMGNSGGGAFDDVGTLIGICSWVSTSGPFLTFFIHHDVIREFLAKEHAI